MIYTGKAVLHVIQAGTLPEALNDLAGLGRHFRGHAHGDSPTGGLHLSARLGHVKTAAATEV
ncbi:MAG: hypothetical protein LBG06_00250 [Deltaproteobacteria bacterium]|jgi:hypothetical protein|nr:hypothetical protein [Deltaproteobacteria bacterium]